MKLSTILKELDDCYTLIQDGEFDSIEQCTRVRVDRALTFLEKEKFIPALDNTAISCVICPKDILPFLPSHVQGIVETDHPKMLFFHINDLLAEKREKIKTVIDPSAVISPMAYVAPYNVVIGKNVEIMPFVCINENTTIMDNVRICAGTDVGSQSFTAVKDAQNRVFLTKDSGSTVIEEGVEICSNCHIAAGTLPGDVTRLGAYTKLDAMVHIGHGTVLGKRVLIPSGAHVAGNCVVGDDVWIGVNATISNRIEIGNRGRVSLGSVVTKNVAEDETVTGNFAIPHKQFMKNLKKSVLEDK